MSEFSNTGAFDSIDAILKRWPGMANHDFEQTADFVEYCRTVSLDDLLHKLESEDRSDEPSSSLIDKIIRDMYFGYDDGRERTRQEDLAVAAEAIYINEEIEVLNAISSGDVSVTDNMLQIFLNKWSFQLQIDYVGSPLAPDGRTIYIPIDLLNRQRIEAPRGAECVVTYYGQKTKVDEDIIEYINRPESDAGQDQSNQIRILAESHLDFDPEEYDKMRSAYGTKAANLFIFADAMHRFQVEATNQELDVSNIEVPMFTIAPIALYQMYISGDKRYAAYLDQIRQQAVAISANTYDPELFRPLVAVRSSAVYSEDNENSSGAGIYQSTVADPRDPESFQLAVEEVFDSLNSEQAQAYLKDKNILNELMGLVIQRYVEEIGTSSHGKYAFGYIHSSDASGRFMELSTGEGEMVYDKSKAEQFFMMQAPYSRSQPAWHYVPDHNSSISKFSSEGTDIANAALFAEKLFGRTVELEFVFSKERGGADVVQVRPLPLVEYNLPEINFPTDVQPIVVCRALGVGNIIVTVRDNGIYREDETTVDWVESEYYQGDSAWQRDKNAVLIIEHNDGHSGHIQMLARERGQLCLYPEPQTRLPNEVRKELAQDNITRNHRRYRIVADGYKAAIYPIDDDFIEGTTRQELLQRTANNLAKLVLNMQKDK